MKGFHHRSLLVAEQHFTCITFYRMHAHLYSSARYKGVLGYLATVIYGEYTYTLMDGLVIQLQVQHLAAEKNNWYMPKCAV